MESLDEARRVWLNRLEVEMDGKVPRACGSLVVNLLVLVGLQARAIGAFAKEQGPVAEMAAISAGKCLAELTTLVIADAKELAGVSDPVMIAAFEMLHAWVTKEMAAMDPRL